jgi:hypothetical protein
VNWTAKRFGCVAPLLLIAGGALTGTAHADLLTNGGFETGTFAPWTIANQTGSSTGGWFIQTGTASPVNSFPVPAPPQGTHAAMTDQGGPGSHVLLQSFTVTPGSKVTLSFDVYVNNFSDFSSPLSLDFNTIPNQQARVDILTANATPFALGSSVLDNVFDPLANTTGYVFETFDITSAVGGGGTFQLRFAEVDNQANFVLGVDGVSMVATPATVPEPGSWILLATVVVGLASRRWGSRRQLRALIFVARRNLAVKSSAAA